MKIEYGCECVNCLVHTKEGRDPNSAPVLCRVNRHGTILNVCSRCDLRARGDKLVKAMVDESTDVKTFFDYDPIVISSDEFKNNKSMIDMYNSNPDIVDDEVQSVLKNIGGLDE